MEPNKLEKEFREKLNKREISPTPNAWDRLDAMLTVAEDKKPKRTYGWLYIAASILGFILIGTVFFSQTEELIDVRKNEVVTSDKEMVQPNDSKSKAIQEQVISTPLKSENTVVISNEKTSKTEQKTKTASIENKMKVAEINKNEVPTPAVNPDLYNQQMAVGANSQIADISQPTIKVDAHKLLSQVDGELEVSFREKAIKTVNKNYKTVKIALANRNQE